MTATIAIPPRSSLSPLLQQALTHLPQAEQEQAAKVAVLSEMGFKDMEIARLLGVTWKQLETARERLRAGIVEAYRDDGASDREIGVSLRLASGRVGELRLHHRPGCLVAQSGDWNAMCSCEAGGRADDAPGCPYYGP